MQIIHIIDDFLFTIFPELSKDHSLIVPTLSFALVIPEGVDELGLNYKKEFEMAKGMSGLSK